jgi:hypothetical protein
VDHSPGRALDCFGIDMPDMVRWGEPAEVADDEPGGQPVKLVGGTS